MSLLFLLLLEFHFLSLSVCLSLSLSLSLVILFESIRPRFSFCRLSSFFLDNIAYSLSLSLSLSLWRRCFIFVVDSIPQTRLRYIRCREFYVETALVKLKVSLHGGDDERWPSKSHLYWNCSTRIYLARKGESVLASATEKHPFSALTAFELEAFLRTRFSDG